MQALAAIIAATRGFRQPVLACGALPEQDLACLFRHFFGRLVEIALRVRALRPMPRRNFGAPTYDFRKWREVQWRFYIGIDPRIARHIGNRVIVADDETTTLQLLVEHAE